MSVCKEQLPDFLSRLHALHEQLASVFPKEAGNTVREPCSAELLQEKVSAALAAADDFDDASGTEALDELLSFDCGEEINELLAGAKNAFQDFDFDAAAEHLKKIALN